MRINYDPDADVLVLVLRDAPPLDSIEEPGGVIIAYGDDGAPVSVEFLGASERGLLDPAQSNVPLQHVSPTS